MMDPESKRQDPQPVLIDSDDPAPPRLPGEDVGFIALCYVVKRLQGERHGCSETPGEPSLPSGPETGEPVRKFLDSFATLFHRSRVAAARNRKRVTATALREEGPDADGNTVLTVYLAQNDELDRIDKKVARDICIWLNQGAPMSHLSASPSSSSAPSTSPTDTSQLSAPRSLRRSWTRYESFEAVLKGVLSLAHEDITDRLDKVSAKAQHGLQTYTPPEVETITTERLSKFIEGLASYYKAEEIVPSSPETRTEREPSDSEGLDITAGAVEENYTYSNDDDDDDDDDYNDGSVDSIGGVGGDLNVDGGGDDDDEGVVTIARRAFDITQIAKEQNVTLEQLVGSHDFLGAGSSAPGSEDTLASLLQDTSESGRLLHDLAAMAEKHHDHDVEFRVEFVPRPEKIPRSPLELRDVARRVLNIAKINGFESALPVPTTKKPEPELDLRQQRNFVLEKIIRDLNEAKGWCTHCEMQLVDHLVRSEGVRVGGDGADGEGNPITDEIRMYTLASGGKLHAYIGCSLGPCWLCKRALSLLASPPSSLPFEMRNSRGNMHPKWGVPEFFFQDEYQQILPSLRDLVWRESERLMQKYHHKTTEGSVKDNAMEAETSLIAGAADIILGVRL